MNLTIIQAKAIPVQRLVEQIGGRYSHTDRKGDLWYFSPFRPDEQTASFKVNEKLNTWHDFGMSRTFAHQQQGSGGDIIDLWCDYHFKDRRLGIKEALLGLMSLNRFTKQDDQFKQQQRNEPPRLQNDTPRYKIIKIADRITFIGLKEELHRRRVSLELASLYLKQGHIQDAVTNRQYTCFLFENDKGGYEVSIPNPSRKQSFKTCIGPKASTRLMASDETRAADIFEGFFDFLSWLEIKGSMHHTNHTYVLNSVSLVNEVCDKIIAFKETIKYVFLFMDNDEAGYQATHAIAEKITNEAIQVGSLEQFYNGAKDLSEFWMNGLRLDR